MDRLTTILASIAAFTVSFLVICNPAEASSRRHWHHCSSCTLYYDYSYGNWQSPTTYIYPAANWGPFFHRVRHYGPVLLHPASPY
jgi:hypothetical protein